ncbi:type VII secretion protein EccCb [Mycolicibacterium holsaticum]|uniref:Type VII secretion protein EccCb n=2 Tax=Mycolicibacterium holsaticum TaxID=152142 RepID=A0A1E3R7P8_9MYCO|nr:type VII secretion protein EccCb [Mycolicibacterium holsaticum]
MVQVSPVVEAGLAFAATPDVMPLVEAEVLARAVAAWEPEDAATRFVAERAADARAGQDFLDLFQIEDARVWDPHALWSQQTVTTRLRAPLGKNPTTGKTVWLDLKEGAEGGMGPHGMLTGATGSGKSETLVSFCLGIAMLHPPETLQMILGDFKGETAMMKLAALPHCQGVVSNLAGSTARLDRFEDMINGETARRETLLSQAGYKDVRDYERARATTRPDLPPLGTLLIVLDEFSELLRIRPKVAETFDVVARKGRGLWMHILNASQRVETGRMAGMIAQQTYSIGLKVKDASQSRAAINSTRAYEDLKGAPEGTGFLVFDDEHTLFRSYYVSAPFIPPVAGKQQRRRQAGQYIDPRPFSAAIQPLPLDIEVGEDPQDSAGEEISAEQMSVDADTVVSVLVERLAAAGRTTRAMHQLYLPPLDETPVLAVDDVAQEFWGRDWLDVSPDSGLVVPYAREDDPFDHSQKLLSVDLSGSKGNAAIIGATQSGKSTALQTLMVNLAVSHSPQRVQFYGIDLGGGKLQSMSMLPHVSGIAGQGNEERITRIISEVERLLTARVRSWELAGIDLAEFRARKFAGKPGEVPEDGHGDIFLIVDNLSALKIRDQDLYSRISELGASSALNYGVHLLITNDQWISLPYNLNSKFGTRIELRMTDYRESEMGDRERAKTVPDQPGRGLKQGGLHFLMSAPVATATYANSSAAQTYEQSAVETTCGLIAQSWQQQGVPAALPLPELPTELAFDQLGEVPAGTLKLGVGEIALDTIGVDLTAAPNFYVVGSSGSGRTTVMRTLVTAIQQTFTPEQAKIIAFDPDLKLAAYIDAPYLAVHVDNPSADVGAIAASIAQRFTTHRRPPENATALERAQWRFSGPRYFIVIDDLNLFNAPGSTTQSRLMPALEPVIERGRQMGVHILASLNISGWMATSAHNKMVVAMDRAGAGVLILDGSPADGAIVDKIRAAPRAPGRGELVYRKLGRQLMQVSLPPARESHQDHGDDSW